MILDVRPEYSTLHLCSEMRLNFLILIIAMLAFQESIAQKHVVQVSGVVVATDSLIPVPYASIYRAKDNRGTFSDYTGYFTMPAQVGDTLHFMFIGLKESWFVIPDDTTQTHISIVQWMEEDEVLLPTVNVLPYPSKARLRQEILALDLPGDQYYKFNREMASVANYDGLRDLSGDAYRESSQTIIDRYSGSFRSGGNLLDPSAWGKFMKALRNGDTDK
jgi:CarboxypepD_reg-like domain